MKLYQCHKTVLKFSPNAAKFLNGYTTNDMDAPRNVFTDIQGKIIAVADQFKKSEDEVWEAVESRFVERLLSHLKTYLSLSDTTVEKLAAKKIYLDLDTRQFVITEQTLPAGVSEEEFTLFRLKNNIPLQGVDFDQEMVLNVAEEELVSYTKGCYLGQEIVARVHYRAKPPKKLVVRSESDCSAEESKQMTSKVFDPEKGQILGFLFDKTEGGV